MLRLLLRYAPLSLGLVASGIALLALVEGRHSPSPERSDKGASSLTSRQDVHRIEARELALLPHSGREPIDLQIRAMQERIRGRDDQVHLLARLGAFFIAKARLSNDPGFYKLAEQSALALQAAKADNAEALLLHGHALAAMHRFKEAEAIARRLVVIRENALDHALLGDALMEQGRLDEAIPAYQQMADLKPGLQAYTRISHLRWLKGDLKGASEIMELAIAAGSPRNPEPVAWATTRLAAYRLQEGDLHAADRLAKRALQLVDKYVPALVIQGRILIAEGKAREALIPFGIAAALNPLPEMQWMLADALRAAGQDAEASRVEQQLTRQDEAADPRTYSLFLSTRKSRAGEALRMASDELKTRQDIFSYDALAWAQYANGQHANGQATMAKALVEETKDARLLLHAGVIALSVSKLPEAKAHLESAREMQAMLLPSELILLNEHLATFPATGEQTASITDQNPEQIP